ncbi:MAG: hypothetical protein K2K19_01870, partial [Acetatifactor sp.]|nr:hypothetical protein [Acetatifactor sp.]
AALPAMNGMKSHVLIPAAHSVARDRRLPMKHTLWRIRRLAAQARESAGGKAITSIKQPAGRGIGDIGSL